MTIKGSLLRYDTGIVKEALDKTWSKDSVWVGRFLEGLAARVLDEKQVLSNKQREKLEELLEQAD